MSSKNRYDREENPFNKPFKNPSQKDQPVKKEMSGCRLIVLIALGILLASFVGCVAVFAVKVAVIKGIGDALQNSTSSHQQTRYSGPVTSNPRMIIQPTNEATNKIIRQMGKEMLENAERVQQKARQKKTNY